MNTNSLAISFLALATLLTSVAVSAPLELLELREKARLVVLKSHCASCHTPEISTTKEMALKIYDLSEKDWSSSMTDRQLKRLEGIGTASPEEIREMRGDPKRNLLTKDDKRTLALFLKGELEFRKKDPADRFKDIDQRATRNLNRLINGKNHDQ